MFYVALIGLSHSLGSLTCSKGLCIFDHCQYYSCVLLLRWKERSMQCVWYFLDIAYSELNDFLMLVWRQGQQDSQRHYAADTLFFVNIQYILKSSVLFVGTHINITRAIAYIHCILSLNFKCFQSVHHRWLFVANSCSFGSPTHHLCKVLLKNQAYSWEKCIDWKPNDQNTTGAFSNAAYYSTLKSSRDIPIASWEMEVTSWCML